MLALFRNTFAVALFACVGSSPLAAQETTATLKAEPGPSLRVLTTPMTRVAVGLATRLDASGKLLALDDVLLAATRDEPTLRGVTNDRGEITFAVPVDPALADQIPAIVYAQVARLRDGDLSPTPISAPLKFDLASLAVSGNHSDRKLSRTLGIALLTIGLSLTVSTLAPPRVKRGLLLVVATSALVATPYLLYKAGGGRAVRVAGNDAVSNARELLRLRLGEPTITALKTLDGSTDESASIVVIGQLTATEELLLRMTMPRHAVRFAASLALSGGAPPTSLFIFLDKTLPPSFQSAPAPPPLVAGKRSP